MGEVNLGGETAFPFPFGDLEDLVGVFDSLGEIFGVFLDFCVGETFEGSGSGSTALPFAFGDLNGLFGDFGGFNPLGEVLGVFFDFCVEETFEESNSGSSCCRLFGCSSSSSLGGPRLSVVVWVDGPATPVPLGVVGMIGPAGC